MSGDLLSVKELAAALRRSVTYVWAMRRQGFEMAGGRATLAEARAWLSKHPKFRISKAYAPPIKK